MRMGKEEEERRLEKLERARWLEREQVLRKKLRVIDRLRIAMEAIRDIKGEDVGKEVGEWAAGIVEEIEEKIRVEMGSLGSGEWEEMRGEHNRNRKGGWGWGQRQK